MLVFKDGMTPVANMTLRDYYAGQALIGIIAEGEAGYESAAVDAFHYADAMMDERDAE
jgi:hypothetical protein